MHFSALFYCKIQLVGLLKEIRLHDFYFKLYHNIIASEIHHRLRDELSNVILVSNKDWKKSKSQEVFTGSGFTNGSGISEVKYVIGEKYGSPVILGIQIQGIQFRIFIESKKGMAIKIAEKLHSNSLWFNFSNVISSGIAESEEYPISKKSSLKKFNTYSNEFYYRYVKLNNCKIKDLIEIVMDYVHIIHREKENIIRALEEI